MQKGLLDVSDPQREPSSGAYNVDGSRCGSETLNKPFCITLGHYSTGTTANQIIYQHG